MTDANSIPSQISHYTTIDGLKGIIESQSLWASNVSFLNDSSELVHALNVIEDAAKRVKIEHLPHWLQLISNVVRRLKEGHLPATYAICFCRDSDNLSQWRGYGGQRQGVNITFDRKKLEKLMHKDGGQIHKVVYTRNSTTRKLSADMKALVEEMDNYKWQDGEGSLFEKISMLIPRYKDIGFISEGEWRCIIQGDFPANRIKFRSAQNRIVPYCEAGQGQGLLPIDFVTVGPGHDQKLTSRSLRAFLDAKNYDYVEVRESIIPFRN